MRSEYFWVGGWSPREPGESEISQVCLDGTYEVEVGWDFIGRPGVPLCPDHAHALAPSEEE